MVVADSGPLIALARLDLLRLLPDQFKMVSVPEVVFRECTHYGDRPGARAIVRASEAGLFTRIVVPDAEQFAADHLLDVGESAALLLAQSRSVPVLVDERKARRVASLLGIPTVGTVGVLVAARIAEQIGPLPPIFSQLHQFGYRLSDKLIQDALRRTHEA
ncbi:MAG: hypothetical protein KJZ96_09135 [Rhodocyclaceae bacterium]|nr:hypothetical protein [Rhodocyclaceae bacterium]